MIEARLADVEATLSTLTHLRKPYIPTDKARRLRRSSRQLARQLAQSQEEE